MPFGYGTRTRTQEYIDVSDAGPSDRVKVTLENGQVVTFQLKELGQKSTTTNLFVDKTRTDQEVLDFCYQQAVSEAIHHARWRERRKYTLEAARTQVEIHMTVVSDIEIFDHSPRAGKRISLCSLFPCTSGSWTGLPSPVKSVEFITV